MERTIEAAKLIQRLFAKPFERTNLRAEVPRTNFAARNAEFPDQGGRESGCNRSAKRKNASPLMLAFFPWLRVREDTRVQEIELLPFDRRSGRADFDTAKNEAVRKILAPYVDRQGRPLQFATILRFQGRDLFADLTEDQIEELFSIHELISVAGISDRDLFSAAGLGYCNAHIFQLLVQRGTGDRLSLRTRRRDGHTDAMWSGDGIAFPRPEHLPGHGIVSLDVRLLEALLRARSTSDWGRVAEAIWSFNLANTDSDQITLQTEVILLIAAIQRLLDPPSTKENDLASTFLGWFKPDACLLPSQCPRLASFLRSVDRRRPVVEKWIRTFYSLRGAMAHGDKRPRVPTPWRIEEHLLMGSHAFTLLLKRWLARGGFYEWRFADQIELDIFERLLCVDLFKPMSGEDDSGSWPWVEIRLLEKLTRGHAERAARMERLLEMSEGGSSDAQAEE